MEMIDEIISKYMDKTKLFYLFSPLEKKEYLKDCFKKREKCDTYSILK